MACALTSLAAAQEASTAPPEIEAETKSVFDAVKSGTTWVGLRYRYEIVRDDLFEDNAYASTLRTVLGYETAQWHGLNGTVELEDVSSIGNALFDSPVEDVPGRPLVRDSVGTSVNRAFASWDTGAETELTLGRQYLRWDDMRWIGNTPWRQKWRTFDALYVESEAAGPVRARYAYVDRMTSPARQTQDSRSHLANVSLEVADLGRATLFGYYIDLPDSPASSTWTAGARFEGEHPAGEELTLLYQIQIARQFDAADNPADREAGYYRVDAGLRQQGLTLKASAEILEGDGDPGSAVQFPFGALRPFNGLADVFFTTPDAGLEDYNVRAVWKPDALSIELALHDFHASQGGAHYGSELDLVGGWTLADGPSLGLGVAGYAADDFADDVVRAWLVASWNF